MKVKAIMHMHTTYSDGVRSLRELVEELDAEIICVSDHAPCFDDRKFKKYVKECEKLSGKQRLVIPCLEVGFKSPHVLALGVNKVVKDVNLKENIKAIKRNGGIAVLAHPYGHKDKKVSMDDEFLEYVKDLDGVEIWNTASHGRRVPSAKAVKFFNKLKEKNKKLIATCGADMHASIQREPYFFIDVKRKTKKDFLDALKKGNYIFYMNDYEISDDGKFSRNGRRVDDKVSFKVRTNLNMAWLYFFGIPIKFVKALCDVFGVGRETRRKLSIAYTRFFGRLH